MLKSVHHEIREGESEKGGEREDEVDGEVIVWEMEKTSSLEARQVKLFSIGR